MEQLTYIHAADLHLDAPFEGIARELPNSQELSQLLKDAPFIVLDRLTALCEKEKPDFLVLAGDIYNEESRSVKAQLRLRQMCAELAQLGIKVFIVHGNHDPLKYALNAIRWPENTVIFGSEQVSTESVEKNGQPLAIVHGISYAEAEEKRNLAQLFQKIPDSACFQLGVLHCAVDSTYPIDGRYAPCKLTDLKQSGLDAWALGHVHKKAILSTNPFIAYSGSTQGLNINECGAHGCYVVKAQKNATGWGCNAAFHPLSPVNWEIVEINLDDVQHWDTLLDLLLARFNELLGKVDISCQALVLRLILRGATELNKQLNDREQREQVEEQCLKQLQDKKTKIWIKDTYVQTDPAIDRTEYLKRDDLLGYTLRLAETLTTSEENKQEILQSAFEPLLQHTLMHTVLQDTHDASGLTLLETEQFQELLKGAERLCIQMLEDKNVH